MKRYVRVEALTRYRVFECADLPAKHWLSAIGAGPTVREYTTDGRELPEEVRAAALASHERGIAPTAVEWPFD